MSVTYQYAPTPPGGVLIHDDTAGTWAHLLPGVAGWDELQAQIESGAITVIPAPIQNLYPQREREESLAAVTDADDLETRVSLLQRMTVGVPQ